ncbi:ComEC family competence protein [Synechococcus sp. MIT S9509]|uniref:ComEC/Rec2 family competence protein n=1 Tax=Synechococcus sp. MIT S9509 TaxID=1801630 RepID=UPI0007BB5A8B|nr:ComEC/Rec2 family competence protein [Synechococcus sp. MIT S9509]KZR92399.1 ComEC family competence protein [Synechococcus sp. MIT S9509]
MKPVFSAGLLLLSACIGAAYLRSSMHWLLLVVLLVCGLAAWGRVCRRPSKAIAVLALMLCLVSVRCGTGAMPQPQPGDPSLSIPPDGKPLAVRVVGRIQADGAVNNGRCRSLLAVSSLNGHFSEGRTELTLDSCTTPLLTGAWIELQGEMRRPQAGSHPLLAGADERLALQRTWSRVRTDAIQVLRQDRTPLADARRKIAQRLIAVAGEQQGGLLAALVLGGAQVPLPQSLRDVFRMAGLSHALAASGFHLSVLLGSTLACTRVWPGGLRLAAGSGAMALFLALAGAQPSVVRAVLMGAAALLIRESGHRSRPLGVLLLTLVVMLLLHPTWARSIGFQLSAAATAGLVISAGPMEQWIAQHLPRPLHRLAPALSIPIAALFWTLPLQLLHFGAAPLYAVLSNLLAAPLLAPLTLAAMALALMVLLLPAALASALLPLLIWPVQQLSWLLISLVHWISQWPWAQLLTGPVHPLLVLAFSLGLLLWLLPSSQNLRCLSLPLLLLVVGLQARVQFRDDLIRVEQWGRQWLLLRHRGRAAMLSSHGDELSCRIATRLSHGLGHQRLDWVAVLDPVGTDQQACWNALARTLQEEQRGRLPLSAGQRLQSDGLSVGVPKYHGRLLDVRFGSRVERLRRSDLQPQSGSVPRV